MRRIALIIGQMVAGVVLGYVLAVVLAYSTGLDVIGWINSAIFAAFGVWGVGALANPEARRWSRFLWTLAVASVMAVLVFLPSDSIAYVFKPDFGYILLGSLVGYWASRT